MITKKKNAWLGGLISAAIGGATTAVTTIVTSPAQKPNWQQVIIVAGLSAIISIGNYLKQSPLEEK